MKIRNQIRRRYLTEAPGDEKKQEKEQSKEEKPEEEDDTTAETNSEKGKKIAAKYLEFIKQLKSAKDYGQYLQLLRKMCQDDNSRKILLWGIQHGIDGNGQNYVEGNVPVSALIPTQNEIGVNDSLAYPLEKDPSGIPKLFKNPVIVGPNPIVVYNDGSRWYILDGHHRWSQVYMINPKAEMRAFILKKGFASGPIGALKNLQLIIGSGTGDIPSSSKSGINIYTASDDQLKNWIQQRLQNSTGQRAIELFNKATGQSLDANGFLEYLMKNILSLKNRTGAWAKKMPSRNNMPQTDKGAGGVQGTVDKASDVVTESKINIRESLNKYDLKTDNRYDLRNLYDSCILTNNDKRIIAEMISRKATPQTMYEALMRKFEGKPLKESCNYFNVQECIGLLGEAADESTDDHVAEMIEAVIDQLMYYELNCMDKSLKSRKPRRGSLKESSRDREVDRRAFASLIKYDTFDPKGNYAILNDGYFVKAFWADNDEEAKEIFSKWSSRKTESLKRKIRK